MKLDDTLGKTFPTLKESRMFSDRSDFECVARVRFVPLAMVLAFPVGNSADDAFRHLRRLNEVADHGPHPARHPG